MVSFDQTNLMTKRMHALQPLFLMFALIFTPLVWAVELTVSAATSLTQAFQEIGQQFEAQNPDIQIRFNFAASGVLLQQIIQGAPVDVFASADTETMDKAVVKGLIKPSDSQIFTTNRLVLVAAESNRKLEVKQLRDLKQPGIQRIAMGLPASVPAGHYARESLETAGLWADIQGKIIGTQNVRQALDYVARGEVDVAFVYATDLQAMNGKVRGLMNVPTPTPIRYPMAILTQSEQQVASRRFLNFVLSKEGQRVLKKWGFGEG